MVTSQRDYTINGLAFVCLVSARCAAVIPTRIPIKSGVIALGIGVQRARPGLCRSRPARNPTLNPSARLLCGTLALTIAVDHTSVVTWPPGNWFSALYARVAL